MILGIETSCDDTAAAIVQNGKLLSSVVSSQPAHDRYGGVVPELASRDHQRNIVTVTREAMDAASCAMEDLTAVAVTYGPGLAGSLLVGLTFSKALAASLDIPLLGINHIEGHIYSVFLEDSGPEFPFLCLIVSGGHTLLVDVHDDGTHRVLGSTRDDAAGEAFDKVAKMLGLSYPGGPVIDKLAAGGDPAFHDFPRAELKGYDFSFSGIKTSMLYFLKEVDEENRSAFVNEHLADLCASFQNAVVDMLMRPLVRAASELSAKRIAITGGVSANTALRTAALDYCRSNGASLFLPDLAFCMDNAAMIAMTGHYKLLTGKTSPLTLTVEPAARLV